MATISGQIKYEGVGVDGVSVSIWGAASASTVTAGGGLYNFAGLANGTYFVAGEHSPSYACRPVVYVVAISGDDVTGKDFTAYPSYDILGTVTALDDSVTIEAVDADENGFSSSPDGGAYDIPYLAPGTYTVTVYDIDSSYIWPHSRTVVITDATVTGQDFAFGYRLSGTVKDALGSGVDGVTISDGTNETTTADGGAWELGPYTSGEHTVTALMDGMTFSPVSYTREVNGEHVDGLDFTASDEEPSTKAVVVILLRHCIKLIEEM